MYELSRHMVKYICSGAEEGRIPRIFKREAGEQKKVAEISFRELIDPRRLQHLQNEFCKVTGVAAVCLDSENQVVTEPYVDKTWKRLDGEDPISTEYRRKAAQADCHG